MKEVNEEIFNQQDVRAQNTGEWNQLGNLIVKLRDPSTYCFLKEFRDAELDAVKKILTWPPEKSIACFDLFRIMMNHHASQALFSG